jgi:predicted O-methyltransferase YrrM
MQAHPSASHAEATSHQSDAFHPLNSYAWDAYSQGGQDGILHEILRRLGVFDADREKWCVEFGAWDGVHLSNTCNLIREHGFRAVMIEADTKRYKQLCGNFPGDEVVKVNRLVTLDGDARLDRILGETDLPEDFDMLSIDIDSCDYHVWQSLENYRPKLVIIEFNPTIPVDIPYVQPPDFTVNQGNGVKAIDDLAQEKGYRTVCIQGGNLIAVREDYLDRVTNATPPPVEDLADTGARNFVFVGYDGTVLSNFDELPFHWHPTTIKTEDIQVLPRFLRHYTGNYSPLHWFAFGALDYWRRFKRLLRTGR